jgi:transcriptional regulator with XRE-family HTH domain
VTVQRRARRRDADWLVEASPRRQTASEAVNTPDIVREANQTASTILTTQADDLRLRTSLLQTRVEETHETAYVAEWEHRTRQRLALGTTTMLAELADRGFAWRDIARLVGVSVPAIQKWRKGGATTPENRRRLAAMSAACDLIERHRSVVDIAQWFDVPLKEGVSISPIDLWSAGQHVLVFEYALEHSGADTILDRFDPEWRERYASDYETFDAGDGQLSIRMRDR